MSPASTCPNLISALLFSLLKQDDDHFAENGTIFLPSYEAWRARIVDSFMLSTMESARNSWMRSSNKAKSSSACP
ncbi:hypothetical protein AKJ16_DCAP08208 [Drosera capensis]